MPQSANASRELKKSAGPSSHATGRANGPLLPVTSAEEDLAALLRAMRPLLSGPEELRTLDGFIAEDGKTLDIRLAGGSFFVPPTSSENARKTGEWGVLADGVLTALRDRHSFQPDRVFEVHHVYEEALKVVLQIAENGLTQKELDQLEINALEACNGMRARAAIAKTKVRVYQQFLTSILKETQAGSNG